MTHKICSISSRRQYEMWLYSQRIRDKYVTATYLELIVGKTMKWFSQSIQYIWVPLIGEGNGTAFQNSCLENLLAILIPACASSSPAFLMMYLAYTLNKQGDNIQPWHTPFPIWNKSVFACPVLTVASWPVYRFLKRQVRWSGIPISFRIFHSLLWPTQSKASV